MAVSGFLWKEWNDNWRKVAPPRRVKQAAPPPVKHPQYGEMDGNYWKNSHPLPKHANDLTPVYS